MSAPTSFEAEIKVVNMGVQSVHLRQDFPTWTKLYVKYFCQSDITRIARQLSLLLKSGVSVHEALELAQDQTEDINLKGILNDIVLQVESGKSVAESFRQYPFLFDDLYTGIVEAGELSGTLELSFGHVASFREKTESITKQMLSSLAYPLLVIAVAVLVAWAILYYVVPIFGDMYDNMGAELPESTAAIIQFSEFIKNSLLHIVVGIAILCGSAVYVLSRISIRLLMGQILSRLPITSKIITSIVTLRFSRTLGVLLLGGVDILRAVEIATKATGLLFAKRALSEVSGKLARGVSVTNALDDARIFPSPLLRLTSVGERTGRLGEMLIRSAEYYESQAEMQLSTLTALVEPLLIISVGCVIAAILVAMYLPLLELTSNL